MEVNKEKYLKLVENLKPQNHYELFDIECGEGWKTLYQPILDYAMEHNIKVHQIKENFGGLRIYLASYDSTVRKMIDDAEEKSYNTCEICGKYIDKPIIDNHWIYPMCNECHKKRKKICNDILVG